MLEFGAGWKALSVGGGRRATVTPFIGDGAKDWVVKKYTHYFSYFESKLLWRTDELPLLGVRDGKRINLYAVAFGGTGNYPWSGWADDLLEAELTSYAPPELTSHSFGKIAALTSQFATEVVVVDGAMGPAQSATTVVAGRWLTTVVVVSVTPSGLAFACGAGLREPARLKRS